MQRALCTTKWNNATCAAHSVMQQRKPLRAMERSSAMHSGVRSLCSPSCSLTEPPEELRDASSTPPSRPFGIEPRHPPRTRSPFPFLSLFHLVLRNLFSYRSCSFHRRHGAVLPLDPSRLPLSFAPVRCPHLLHARIGRRPRCVSAACSDGPGTRIVPPPSSSTFFSCCVPRLHALFCGLPPRLRWRPEMGAAEKATGCETLGAQKR